MGYRHLSIDEREQISRGLAKDLTLREIGRRLGRSAAQGRADCPTPAGLKLSCCLAYGIDQFLVGWVVVAHRHLQGLPTHDLRQCRS